MGRGDRRTKRGKIWRGSYGRTRPSNKSVTTPSRGPQPRQAAAPPPVVEETAPVVEETTPVVEETTPVVEETDSAVEAPETSEEATTPEEPTA